MTRESNGSEFSVSLALVVATVKVLHELVAVFGECNDCKFNCTAKT